MKFKVSMGAVLQQISAGWVGASKRLSKGKLIPYFKYKCHPVQEKTVRN